jgi:phosphoglycerate dehydrogenase-like enzyme
MPAGPMAAPGAESVALPTLLTEADFIALHVRLTEETWHLIGRAAIAQMKPGI